MRDDQRIETGLGSVRRTVVRPTRVEGARTGARDGQRETRIPEARTATIAERKVSRAGSATSSGAVAASRGRRSDNQSCCQGLSQVVVIAKLRPAAAYYRRAAGLHVAPRDGTCDRGSLRRHREPGHGAAAPDLRPRRPPPWGRPAVVTGRFLRRSGAGGSAPGSASVARNWCSGSGSSPTRW